MVLCGLISLYSDEVNFESYLGFVKKPVNSAIEPKVLGNKNTLSNTRGILKNVQVFELDLAFGGAGTSKNMIVHVLLRLKT